MLFYSIEHVINLKRTIITNYAKQKFNFFKEPEMLKHSYILVLMIFLLSCVTTKDIEENITKTRILEKSLVNLQNQMERNNQQTNQNLIDLTDSMNNELSDLVNSMSVLISDMQLFEKTYDPETRNKLIKNLKTAKRVKKDLLNILKESQTKQEQILLFHDEAKTDRQKIAENRQQSESDNVINEFELLRDQWKDHSNEMNLLVEEAQGQVAESHRAALTASRSSVEASSQAQDAARRSSETRELVNSFQSRIDRLSGRMDTWNQREDNLKDDLIRIERDLNNQVTNNYIKTESNTRSIDDLLFQIRNLIQNLDQHNHN